MKFVLVLLLLSKSVYAAEQISIIKNHDEAVKRFDIFSVKVISQNFNLSSRSGVDLSSNAIVEIKGAAEGFICDSDHLMLNFLKNNDGEFGESVTISSVAYGTMWNNTIEQSSCALSVRQFVANFKQTLSSWGNGQTTRTYVYPFANVANQKMVIQVDSRNGFTAELK